MVLVSMVVFVPLMMTLKANYILVASKEKKDAVKKEKAMGSRNKI